MKINFKKIIKNTVVVLMLVFAVLFVSGESVSVDAATANYTAYNSSGANKGGYGGLADAISAAGNNGKVRVNGNINFKSSITITNTINLDLNGKTLTRTDAGSFFIVKSGGRLNLTSSSGKGTIRAVSQPILLDREQNTKARPVVDLRDVTVHKTGNNSQVTILNIGGGLYIRSGATVSSVNNYNSIWQRYLNSYSTPSTYIYDGATIHGMLLGTTSSWGGEVYVYGGNIYNRGDSNAPFMKQGNGSAYLNLSGGNYRVDSLSKIAASGITVNASGYRIDNFNSSGPWYTLKKYATNTYDLKGNSFAPGKTPHAYNYLGTAYKYPTASDIVLSNPASGVKFAGWYNNASYTSGPYSGKASGLMEDRNLHARFIYTLEFDPNDVDSEKNGENNYPITEPHQGTMANVTFNYGIGVTNSLPINNYSRPGYVFLGWAVDKNATTPLIPASTRTGINLDPYVLDGKVKLYAIWEAEKNKSTYGVKYFFEQLDGSFLENPAYRTRFYSTAGRTSNPGIRSFDGYEISNDHLAERRVLVKGNGSSEVSLYYKLKYYTTSFDLGGNAQVTNLAELKNLYGEDNVSFDEITGKLSITAKNGTTIINPEFTVDSNFGYTFGGFIDSYNKTSKDLEVRTNWIPKEFDYTFITHDRDGNVNSSVDVTQKYNEKLVLPKPDKFSSGYFVYYKDSQGNIYNGDSLATNLNGLTLYAYYQYGTPSSTVKLEQRSNNHIIVTRYTNYEYRLVVDGQGAEDGWQDESAFYNLDPNTEYQIEVRFKAKADNSYFLASEPISIEVKTTSDLNITNNGHEITISNPDSNTIYGLKDSNGNIITGEANRDGSITFTNLEADKEYELVSKVPPKATTFTNVLNNNGDNIILETASSFVGNNKVVIDEVNEGANKVIITGIAGNEYSVDGGNTWLSLDGNNKFEINLDIFNNGILVRNSSTQDDPASFSASTETIFAGVVPFGHELNHLVIDDYIEAKEGFNYYDEDDILIEVIEGKIDVSNDRVVKITREAITIGDDDYLESAAVTINKFNPPVPSLDYTTSVTEDSITLSDLQEGHEYYILIDGEYVYGNIVNGEVTFSNLEYATDYPIYVVKTDENNPYSSDRTLAGTVKTDRKEIVIDLGYENSPQLDVLEVTDSSITIAALEGFTYRLSIDGVDVVPVLENGELTFPGLSNGREYTIYVGVDNEFEYSSNEVEFKVTTAKSPLDFSELVYDDLEVEVFENTITITNGNTDFEYAVVKKGELDYSNLVYLSGEEITFREIMKVNSSGTIIKEDLELISEYQIIIRKKEDTVNLTSEAGVANLENPFDIDEMTTKTGKQTTPNVSLPTIAEINELKDLIVYDYQQLEVLEKEGYEFLYISLDDYIAIDKENISDNDLLAVSITQESIDINVNIGDVYFIYGRKIETDSHEPSQFFLIDEVTITKANQARPEMQIPVIYVGDDNVIVTFEEGYDYSVDGVNWIRGFNGNYRFSDLEGNTEYHIFVRNSETETHFPSGPKLGATVTTSVIESTKVPMPSLTELVVETVLHNTFTIEAIAGYEYSIDGEVWLTETNGKIKFSNLDPETEYTVYVRYPETDKHEASIEVSLGLVKTLKEKPTLENAFYNLKVTEDKVEFTTIEGYQYSTDGGFTWETGINDYELLFAGETQIKVLVRRGQSYIPVEFTFGQRDDAVLSEEDKEIEILETKDSIEVTNPKEHLEYALYEKVVETIDDVEVTSYNQIKPYVSLGDEHQNIIFDDLEANKTYYLYTRVKETEENLVSLPFVKEVQTNKLKGQDLTVFERNVESLVYDEENEKLTFKITNDLEGLEYSVDGINFFTINDLKKGTEGDYFLLQIDDVEEFENLYVRRSETLTHLVSNTFGVTEKNPSVETILPQEMITELDNITDTSVTIYEPDEVEDIEIFEFTINGIDWFSFEDGKIVFTNLEPNTNYQILVRVKDSGQDLPTIPKVLQVKLAIDDSIVNAVKTAKTFIDLEDETVIVELVTEEGIYISASEEFEYSIDGSPWRSDLIDGNLIYFAISDFTKTDYEIKIRIKDNEVTESNEVVATIIPTTNYEPIYQTNAITLTTVTFVSNDLYEISKIVSAISEKTYVANKLKSAEFYYVYVNFIANQFLAEKENVLAYQLINGELQAAFETPFSDEDRTILVKDGIFQFNELYEYKPSNSQYQDEPEYDGSLTYKVRIKEAGNKYPNSLEYDLIIRLLQAEDPEAYISIYSSTSTTIKLKPEADQEYSVDGGLTWLSDNIEVEFTGLTPATEYEIITRIKASGNIMASEAVSSVRIMTKPFEVRDFIEDHAVSLNIIGDPFVELIIKEVQRLVANESEEEKYLAVRDNAILELDKYKAAKDLVLTTLEDLEVLEDLVPLPEKIENIINNAVKLVDINNYDEQDLLNIIIDNATDEINKMLAILENIKIVEEALELYHDEHEDNIDDPNDLLQVEDIIDYVLTLVDENNSQELIDLGKDLIDNYYFENKNTFELVVITTADYSTNVVDLESILEVTLVKITIVIPLYHELEQFKVNGEDISLSGNTYEFIITANTTIEFSLVDLLALEIINAKADLELLKDDASSKVLAIINNGQNNIDNATSPAEIEDILEATKDLIAEQLIFEMIEAAKDAAKDELENYIDEPISNAVQKILDKAFADIDEQLTVRNLASIVASAKANIDAQLAIEALENYTEDAKDELEAFALNLGFSGNLLDDYLELLDEQTNYSNVDSVLEEAKEEITKAKVKETLFDYIDVEYDEEDVSVLEDLEEIIDFVIDNMDINDFAGAVSLGKDLIDDYYSVEVKPTWNLVLEDPTLTSNVSGQIEEGTLITITITPLDPEDVVETFIVNGQVVEIKNNKYQFIIDSDVTIDVTFITVLEKAIKDAQKTIDNYLTDPSEKALELIDLGKAFVASATTLEEVADNLESVLKALTNSIILDEKEKEKTAILADYDPADYSPEKYEELATIIDDALAGLFTLDDIENFNYHVEIKDSLDNVLTLLDEAIIDARQDLIDYITSTYDVNPTAESLIIVEDQVSLINSDNYLTEELDIIIEDSKELLDDYYFNKIIADKVLELTNYAGDNLSPTLESLLEDLITNIEAGENYNNVIDRFNDAVIAFDAQKLSEDIAQTKVDLRTALEAYIEDVDIPVAYLEDLIDNLVEAVDETNYTDLATLINDGKASLLDAENNWAIDELDNYLLVDDSLVTKAIITNAKLDLENLAIDEIKDFVESIMIEVVSQRLKEALEDYIDNVDLPNDYLETLIDNLVNEVDEANYTDLVILINDGKEALLNSERDYAENILTNYLDKNDTAAVIQIVNDALIALIDLDIEEIKDFIDDVKDAVDAQRIVDADILQARSDLRTALEAYINDVDGPKDYLEALIDNLVDEVDETNYENIATLIIDGKEALLDVENNWAVTELDNYLLENDSPVTKAKVIQAKEDLEDLDIEEIKDFVESIKDIIDDRRDLEETSITELETYAGASPSEAVQDILDKAYDDIFNEEDEVEINNIISAAKDAIDLQQFSEYQEEAKDLLEHYAGLEPSAEVQDILDGAYLAIEAANNETEVDNVVSQTKDAIDIQQEVEGIAQAKVDLRAALEDYIEDVVNPTAYLEVLITNLVAEVDATNYTDLATLINEGKEALLDAENNWAINELDNYLLVSDSPATEAIVVDAKEELEDLDIDEFKDFVDSIKDIVADRRTLELVSKADLETFAGLDPSAEVQDILDAAYQAIELEPNEAEVNNIVTQAKEAIALQKVVEAKDELRAELEDYIEDVVIPTDYLEDLIDNLVDRIDETNYTDLAAFITAGKEDLLDAENDWAITELDNYLEDEDGLVVKDIIIDAKANLDNLSIDEIKDFVEVTKDLVDDRRDIELAAKAILDTQAGVDPSDEVQAMVDAAYEEIKNTEDEAEIDQIVADTLTDIIAQQDFEELTEYQETAKAELEDFAGDNPSDEVQAIIDDAIAEIDGASTEAEIDQIVTTAKADITAQQELEEFKEYQEAAKEDLETFAGLNPSDEVQAIIDAAYDDINAADTKAEIDQIVATAKDDITTQQELEEFTEYQEQAKTELEDFAGSNRSAEVQIIIDDAHIEIDGAETKAKVDQIVAAVKADITTQQELEEFIKYQEDAKEELKDYAGDDVDEEIQDVLDEAYEEIDKAQTKPEVDQIVENTKEEIDEIIERRKRVTTPGYDETKDYDDKDDSNNLFGSVYNELGIDDGVSLVVVNVDLTVSAETDLKQQLQEGTLNIIENWIDEKDLDGQVPFAQLEIKLVDKDGNPVDSSTYQGTYIVKFLLPKALRGYENIRVIYVDSDNNIIEVFKTETDENYWVTFETNHFSYFYLLGDQQPKVIDLWWLIILLAIIILLEIAVIVFKAISNRDNKNLANALFLPILASVNPPPAWTIIIIEIVIIVILLLVIIYLFLDRLKPLFQKKEEMVVVKEEPVIIKEEPKKELEAPVGFVKVTRTIYNYSFISRLHLNDKETDKRYNDLKNHLLSYKGVSSNISWRQETFTVKGKMVVKLRLQGKTMRVYIGLDPTRFVDTKYNIEDNSKVKSHETTPSLQMVRGPQQLAHAKELIDMFMTENEVVKDDNYSEQDYTLKKVKRDKLIEMDLVKVQSADFIEKAKE